jgi:AcrR family transcriptional regulator
MPPRRSDEARRRVLAAATDLIIERGVGNLSIEEVAARSGVAKTTIYRHWPERPSLVLDAVRSHFEHVGSPDTGTLRGDLLAFFGLMDRCDLSGTVGDIMPSIIDAARRDPEMAQLVDRVGAERERGLMRIVERARGRGEIDTDLDGEQLVGVLVGPIVFQKVVRRRRLTPAYVHACVDVALAGIARNRPGTRHGERRSAPHDLD